MALQLPSRHGVFDSERAARATLPWHCRCAHLQPMHHLAETIDAIFTELMALIDAVLERVLGRTSPPSSSS
jgi:hypothetical protein